MKPSPQQICDALIILQKAGVDLNSIREVVPPPESSMGAPRFYEYSGLSYGQAAEEAERLIDNKSGHAGWFNCFERLAELRKIMLEHQNRWPK